MGRPRQQPAGQSEAVRAAAAAVADAVAQEPARPIVRNRRIERQELPAWEADSLPFEPLVMITSLLASTVIRLHNTGLGKANRLLLTPHALPWPKHAL